MFNQYKDQIKPGELESEYSELLFFLPSITDRSEEVNKFLNNISITHIDITQNDFNQWLEKGQSFEPHQLVLYSEKKEAIRDCVVTALNHIAMVSNCNLMINADGFLWKKDTDVKAHWVGKGKTRVPSENACWDLVFDIKLL